jgi:spoIIIJ-associated protein
LRTYEAEARTVEEAVNLGLEKLGASIGEVDIQVIHEGSKGLFGFFGSRQAKVKLTIKQDENLPDAARAIFQDALGNDEEEQDEAVQVPKVPEQKPAEKPAVKSAEKTKEKREKKPRVQRAKKQQKPEKTQKVKPAVQRDIESLEGIAQAFLQEVTKLMGLDVSVHSSRNEEGNVQVVFQGDPQGILIGRRGETLDALQYLTSLQVNRGGEGYTRVTLDSEGYRAKREDSLMRLANRMANRAKKTRRKVRLEPMNPYERRIIHTTLQKVEGVTTYSEGEEPYRKIVISPDEGAKKD